MPDLPDDRAIDEHFESHYDELRRLAHEELSGERSGHTLRTTALLHEAYLRLKVGSPVAVRDETHFKRLAARTMRHVLIDYAKSRNAEKRSGERVAVFHSDVMEIATRDPALFLDLDSAIRTLAARDDKAAAVVELRLFGDLTEEETAIQLGKSARYVRIKLKFARSYLQDRLNTGAPGG